MPSTGNGDGNKTAASLLSPKKGGVVAPVTSTTSLTGSATSPSHLNSMRAANSTASSKPAPTGPSKKSDSPANTHQDKPNVNNVNAHNAAGTGTAAAATRPDHGRRSGRAEDANRLNAEKPGNAYRPADKELSQNVKVVQDDILNREQAQREQAERAQRQKEKLEQHVSESPTGFQAALPRLNELDVANSWDKLLRMMRSEHDMSCLTSCLARELDEDVAWNPEMLLVQLTSDMLDAAELQKDSGEAYVPVDASDIGQMTGSEVARKRKAKRTKAAGGEGEPVKDTEKPATASPPPTSPAATSKTPRKQATTDPAAAEPKKTQTGKAQNAGPTSTGNFMVPQKGSAAGSTSGAAGGGGGSKTNAAPSTAKRDGSKDTNATKGSSSKKQTSKLPSK